MDEEYSVEDFLDGIDKLSHDDRLMTGGLTYEAVKALREKAAAARADLERNYREIDWDKIDEDFQPDPKLIREASMHNLKVMLDAAKEYTDKGQPKSREFSIVENPRHYSAGDIEAKDALASMFAMSNPEYMTPMAYYWWGCAFKYLWRWTNKGGVFDLNKAKQCIDFLLEEYEDALDGRIEDDD